MNPAEPLAQNSPLRVTRHPPEHGLASAPAVLPAGCCCCCCCCCLHTLGGLGGAALGSTAQIRTAPARMLDPDSPFPYRRDVFEEDQPLIPPVLLYWLMVLLTVGGLVGGIFAYSAATSPSGPDPGALFVGLFIAVMVLPGLQLIASLLAFLVVVVFYPERSYSLRRIGKITLWSFAGTALGLLLMGGCVGILYVATK
jgi:hypothetical protein